MLSVIIISILCKGDNRGMDGLQQQLENEARYKELAEQIKPLIEKKQLERNESTTVSVRYIPFNDEKDFKYSTFKLKEDSSFPYDILGRSYENRTIRVMKYHNTVD